MIVTQSYIVTIMHQVFKQLVIKTKKKFLKIPPLSRVPFHLSFWIIEITGENEKIEKPTECTVTYQEWGSASWLVKLSLRLPRAVALTVLYQPPPEWSRVFPSFINLARKRKSKTLRNFFSNLNDSQRNHHAFFTTVLKTFLTEKEKEKEGKRNNNSANK